MAELADALDLGSSSQKECRFDSCHPHLGFYRVKSIHAVRAFFFGGVLADYSMMTKPLISFSVGSRIVGRSKRLVVYADLVPAGQDGLSGGGNVALFIRLTSKINYVL